MTWYSWWASDAFCVKGAAGQHICFSYTHFLGTIDYIVVYIAQTPSSWGYICPWAMAAFSVREFAAWVRLTELSCQLVRALVFAHIHVYCRPVRRSYSAFHTYGRSRVEAL